MFSHFLWGEVGKSSECCDRHSMAKTAGWIRTSQINIMQVHRLENLEKVNVLDHRKDQKNPKVYKTPEFKFRLGDGNTKMISEDAM